MKEPKKRGRKPKILSEVVSKPLCSFPINENARPEENKRLTEWENRLMSCLVENGFDVTGEDLKGGLDEFGKRIALQILDAMTEKTGKFWVRRTNEEVYDFVVRYTLRKNNESTPAAT